MGFILFLAALAVIYGVMSVGLYVSQSVHEFQEFEFVIKGNYYKLIKVYRSILGQ